MMVNNSTTSHRKPYVWINKASLALQLYWRQESERSCTYGPVWFVEEGTGFDPNTARCNGVNDSGLKSNMKRFPIFLVLMRFEASLDQAAMYQ